jgi:hypothetical protein
MNQTRTLLWKEWREAQAYLWIGLGVFLGLPLIAAMMFSIQNAHRFEVDSSYWVTCFGGVLAVFTAVGCTCRDLSGRLEDFWRAVPVGIGRWMGVKFLVGLLTVLTACTLPPLVEMFTNRFADSMLVFVFYDFFAVAVYSVAFAAGCLLRRTAHAAMVGLAGMLLIWFLPLILPPLAWLNLFELDSNIAEHWHEPRQLAFAAAMVILAAAGLALAIVTIRRSWRIESGVKMIYCSLAAAFLILCASASFQLGTTLPILQAVDLPEVFTNGWAGLSVNGDRVILTQDAHYNEEDPRTHAIHGKDVQTLYKFRIEADRVQLVGHSSLIDGRPYWPLSAPRLMALADGTFGFCGVGTENNDPKGPLKLSVTRCDQNGLEISTNTSPIQLWDLDGANNDSYFSYSWNKHLYVLGLSEQKRFAPLHANRQAIIDISDPLSPKLIFNCAVDFSFNRYFWHQEDESHFDDQFIIHLPELPDLPPRERLKLCLTGYYDALENDTLCIEHRNGELAAYRLKSLTDTAAIFTRLGAHEIGIVERVFGRSGFGRIQLENGLLYQMRAIGSDHSYEYILSVYDTRGPHPMRMIGHFATADAHNFAALPDGRALVGGSKLWVVGPPPTVR